MPVTQQQAIMLAELAAAARPYGARHWDKPGIIAAIRQVAHLHLADVALAVMRAADNAQLDTPGAIANTQASCWHERGTGRAAATPAQICPHHGTQFHGTVCPSCQADQLGGTTRPSHTPTTPRERRNWRALVAKENPQ